MRKKSRGRLLLCGGILIAAVGIILAIVWGLPVFHRKIEQAFQIDSDYYWVWDHLEIFLEKNSKLPESMAEFLPVTEESNSVYIEGARERVLLNFALFAQINTGLYENVPISDQWVVRWKNKRPRKAQEEQKQAEQLYRQYQLINKINLKKSEQH